MTVIVTDTGFAADDWTSPIVPLPEAHAGANAILVPPGTDPAALAAHLSAPLIAVAFPAFSDGRGFTIAAQLRRMGYAGRLRAAGPLIADQYAMARRAGFDEVAIPDEMAARQPEDQWLARADWRAHDYRSRLRA